MSPKIRRALFALTVLTLLPVALLNGQLELERSWRAQTPRRIADMTLPSPTMGRLLALNYNTLAADVMWLALTAQHGEFVRYQSRASDKVLDNATKLARTDPFFYRVYHWASGAFLNRRYPITDEDLHRVANLMEYGIDHHTADPDLRMSLALLFVGYGRGFTDAQLVRQSQRALKHLDKAVQLSPDDLQIIGTRTFFRRRIQKYGGKVEGAGNEPDAQFWFGLYMSTSEPRVRFQAANELRRLGAYASLVQDNVMRLQNAHQADKPYVPIELWLLTKGGPGD